MVIPWIFYQEEIESVREWYEDDTISVSKIGVINSIISIGTGETAEITKLIKPNGSIDITSDVQ